MNDRIDRWVGRLSTGRAGRGPRSPGGRDVNSWTGDDENAKPETGRPSAKAREADYLRLYLDTT